METTDEPAVDTVFLTRRRMIRWATVLTIGILVVLAVWQAPSYAVSG